MLIQVVNTTVETKPTQKGSYQQLELVYKNLTYQGKIESKKIMSFGAGASAFTILSKAGAGSTWEITVVKNAQGYNDWTSVAASDGAQAATPAPSAINSPKAAVGATRSTYETPEERAQRQILIVRQSCLSVACNTLGVGAKAVKPDDVIALAKRYSDYVFDVKGTSDQRETGPSGFDDIPDFDVPTVD